MGSKEENETIINWNEASDEVSIYTASKPVAHKCGKLGYKLVKTDKMKGEDCSWWYAATIKNVGFRKGNKSPTISCANREAMRSRAKSLIPNRSSFTMEKHKEGE